MNIKEMHTLCERLLREGVNPLTPIVIINKEEGHSAESTECLILEEVDSADLAMSSFRPDASPKMVNALPITGPVLMLTSPSESGENIEGFVDFLTVPNLENLGTVYGRSQRVYPPTEFDVVRPVFGGLPQKEEAVSRKWLLGKLRHSLPAVERLPYNTNYENWVTKAATVEGEANIFSDYSPGIYANVDESGDRCSTDPYWVYLRGVTHEYLVNLATQETYVMLDGGKTWLPWTNDEDVVADYQSVVNDNIENFI